MEMRELHWLMDMITHINVGLVVFDRQGKVMVWNHFMENHSGISSTEIKNADSLFDRFPVFHEPWLQRKLDSVLLLENEAFISWEQNPHLFEFAAYRPITSRADRMFQNVSFNKLQQVNGDEPLISMMVYDVTDIAVGKRSLQKTNAELQVLSRTDRLTGLYNRGYWQEQLSGIVARYRRYQTPASLILFDIDHFKAVNDTHGHQAGDEVIKMVADLAKDLVRDIDVLGRYGGEEFAILLPETELGGAEVLAERLRAAVAAAETEHETKKLKVTVSLGVAQISDALAAEQAWIEAADQALYRAKGDGRNCVRLASD